MKSSHDLLAKVIITACAKVLRCNNFTVTTTCRPQANLQKQDPLFPTSNPINLLLLGNSTVCCVKRQQKHLKYINWAPLLTCNNGQDNQARGLYQKVRYDKDTSGRYWIWTYTTASWWKITFTNKRWTRKVEYGVVVTTQMLRRNSLTMLTIFWRLIMLQ